MKLTFIFLAYSIIFLDFEHYFSRQVKNKYFAAIHLRVGMKTTLLSAYTKPGTLLGTLHMEYYCPFIILALHSN